MKELQLVVVTTRTGLDIRGLLREVDERFCVLTAAAVMVENGQQVAWRDLPGEVVIPLANVDYYQRGVPPSLVGLGG